MGYGQFIYRRSSGIYVARLSVPAQFQNRIGRREIHTSTEQRSRLVALSIASAVADCWRRVFSDFGRLDELTVADGSPLLAGKGIIALMDAATALGMEPRTLALELVNAGSSLMANAIGWNACDVPELSAVEREDGYYLWASVQAEGQSCTVFGLVTLLDSEAMVVDLQTSPFASVYRIRSHRRESIGELFAAPGAGVLGLSDLLVRKSDVESLRLTYARNSAAALARRKSGGATGTGMGLPTTAIASGKGAESLLGPEAETFCSREGPDATRPGQAPAVSSSALASSPRDDSAAVATERTLPLQAQSSTVSPRHSSMGVTALIDAFVREKSEPEVGGTRGSWKPDEVLRTRQKLRCFPEFMGDLTMAELNLMPEAESTIREYITRLMTLPTGPNLSKARADDTAALAPQLAIWAQRNKVATMTFETAQGYVSKLAECFKWGIKKTYMQVNPAAGMGNDRRQARERPDLDRSLFSNFELGRIFGMPWFVEGRAAQTVSGKPGKQFRPYYYWIPLLALHCGGRANEIAQLYLADICVSAGNTPYIAFRLDRPDKLDIDERDGPDTLGEKSLKTVNSERDVPIHSSLIELGFLDYVEELRGAGHFRLFPELRFDRLKGYGLEASKWFNDRLLGRKLLIVRDGTKTLHSLRHHFATGIDPLGKHPRVQSQLLGHERGETLGQKRYTKDLSVEELRAYLDAIRFQLPDICRFDCKAALVAVKYALAVKRRNGTSA